MTDPFMPNPADTLASLTGSLLGARVCQELKAATDGNVPYLLIVSSGALGPVVRFPRAELAEARLAILEAALESHAVPVGPVDGIDKEAQEALDQARALTWADVQRRE